MSPHRSTESAGALLGGDTSAAALGGTRAADGGTDPADAVAGALLAGAEGDCFAGLWGVAVEVTDDGSEDGSEEGGATTRGAGDSTFVTGVSAAVVGDAGATAVTTGEVVTCVTGGAWRCDRWGRWFDRLLRLRW